MGDLQCSPVNGSDVKQVDDLLLVALTEAGLDEIAAKPDVSSPTISENTDSSSDPATNGATVESGDCMLQPSCSSVEPDCNVDGSHLSEGPVSLDHSETTLDRGYLEVIVLALVN